MKRGKIAVIGVGTVGASAVFALMMHNVGNEIVLVDVDKDRAIGETLDLQDAVHFSNTKKIWNGTAKDARDAQIVGKNLLSQLLDCFRTHFLNNRKQNGSVDLPVG
jgi:CO dehydrogenase nickel-insertion accessory protein CooC1